MGSIPCNLYCCSSSSVTPPKSDLFVPQINIKSIQSNKGEEKNFVTSLKEKSPDKKRVNRITTEQFIQDNNCLKNTYTADGNIGRKLNISFTFKNNSYSIKELQKFKNSKKNLIKLSLTNYSINKGNKMKSKKEQKEENQPKEINFEVSEHLLSKKEEINISNIFLYHYLFHKTNEDNLKFIIKKVKEFQIEENSPIFKEGDPGSCIFIIQSGTVLLSSVNSKNQKILQPGMIFGELALVKNNVKRTYDAKAMTNVSFYSLENSVFQDIKANFIHKNPFKFELFNFLDEDKKDSLELLTTSLEFKKDQIITDLNGLFWIKNGTICLCDLDGKEKDIYGTNEFIGILRYSSNKDDKDFDNSTIMGDNDNEKSNMKIIAKEDVLCYVIPDFAFIEVFGIDFKVKLFYSFLNNTICQNKYMKSIIESSSIKDIIKIFSLQEYRNNDMLSSELPDDIQRKIIIIVEGHACAYTNNGEEKNLIAPCQIIGEELLLGEEPKNIIVESNHLISLECSWDSFKEKILLMDISLDECINELNTIYFFKDLSVYKLIEIRKNIVLENFEKNAKIIKKGEKVEFVYYIKNGTVIFEEDNEIFKEYHEGNSFGEIIIFNGKPAYGEVTVTSDKCTLFKMTKQFFFDLLSEPILNKRTKQKLCLEDMELFPKNLFYIATLHKGTTSNIYLVHNKIYVYVMKAFYIQKFYQASAFEGKAVRNVLNEKEASKIMDNPFLLKYVKTLKNNNWCFFIEEFINGILLSEYIRMYKPFKSMEITRFYSACFLLMLEALQRVGLIHRDIRQDNIIIGKNGYPKLIDFSCCKRVLDGKTNTLIGTPYFMAPEVLKGRKYSYSCDYWSVGVLIYYLFYGEYPFGNNITQPDTIYKEIINKTIEYKEPDFEYNDNDLQLLLNGLLNKDEKERISNLDQVKKLEFFHNVDFNKLKRQDIKSPFIPEVVKFNYNKELNNISKPFNLFILDEKIENNPGLNQKKELVYYYENENDLIYHVNLMKWFEKF